MLSSHLHLDLLNVPFLLAFHQNPICIILLRHACYIPLSSSLTCRILIYFAKGVRELLTTQFSTSCQFISLRSKYSPRNSVCLSNIVNKTSWPKSERELYRPSGRRLSAKLVPTVVVRGCCVVSTTDPHSRILGFLDRSRYYFFQVAPQLYSRG
jgi:hypothetical protein